MRLSFNKNHKKWFLKDVCRAIATYGMVEENEPVCVALSGGKDSVALLFMLWYLNCYKTLSFPLSACHIKTDDYDTTVLKDLCGDLEIPYFEGEIRRDDATQDTSNICYICSRLKRGALKELLEPRGIFKVAYGHHGDDVAETFFMKMVTGKTLGSFSPVVGVPLSRLEMIRPMIYLRERTVAGVHAHVGLPLLEYTCPHGANNQRADFKERMAGLEDLFGTPDFVERLVASLENVDHTNAWEALKVS